MDDRIAALENKVDLLMGAVDRIGIRQIAIKETFARLVGPVLAGAGQTPEDIRRVRDRMSGGALWLTIPEAGPERSDELTRQMSEELADLLEAVAEQAQLAIDGQAAPPVM